MANIEITKNGKAVKIDSTMKRRRLRVGDPDFAPPDGGWGWLIVFACGFSNVSLLKKCSRVLRQNNEKFFLVESSSSLKIAL